MMMTVITNNRLALGTLRQASKVTRCTAARQSRGSSGWALVEQRCHGTYLWKFFRNQGTWLGFELRSKPNIVIKVGTVERTPWTMRAQDGTVRFLYLAAKTSPSFYPCHWVSNWVSEYFQICLLQLSHLPSFAILFLRQKFLLTFFY